MEGYFAGIDIGSTMTKVVIMKEIIITSVIGQTGPEHRRMSHKVMEEALVKSNLSFEDLTYIVATGYGRINVPFADKQITEISCHAKGVHSLLPSSKTIIDIGGQDCKGIKLKEGNIVNFFMNDKCAAGTGRFLEVIAEALGVKLEELGKLSLVAKKVVKISNTCTVFAEQEVVSQLARGESLEDLIAGIHESIASRIFGMVTRLKVEPEVAVTGGGAKNIGLIKALETKLGYPLLIPPDPFLTGAIGAALLGKDIAEKATRSGKPLVRVERSLREASLFT